MKSYPLSIAADQAAPLYRRQAAEFRDELAKITALNYRTAEIIVLVARMHELIQVFDEIATELEAISAKSSRERLKESTP